jgi:hypothetical protein
MNGDVCRRFVGGQEHLGIRVYSISCHVSAGLCKDSALTSFVSRAEPSAVLVSRSFLVRGSPCFLAQHPLHFRSVDYTRIPECEPQL